ncbi:hypothetical protein QR680_006430 [Steinernema hermaphroditum]|uniref:[histone H3]-trimethyl-L-lysine(4) demethylase n=1 Tax=Steinernema hermaphroditum TaxID=289476 RepID=A0AA39HVI1_9BILA|nr:hypothetical protein QR680_006430 [Steinernema hermaphroditum]
MTTVDGDLRKAFVRPPFAPIFYPTEEEFRDPIAYVASIRPKAERFGVIKIIPPESFKPPFAIDLDTFEFTPRDQRLNEIDATAKARMVFCERHSRFWEMQGTPFAVPHLERRNLDVFGLYKAVELLGDAVTVNREKKWGQVAKLLGYTMSQGNALKNVYMKWIEPYLRLSHKVNVKKEYYEPNPTGPEDVRPTIGTSRMMAGLKPHIETTEEPLFKRDIDELMCDKCGLGHDEHLMLLCENCDRALHTYCSEPAFAEVPKGDWHCPSCVSSAVRALDARYGFHDSGESYTLNTFKKAADEFKIKYFNMELKDISPEMVEEEYWRNVHDLNKCVTVKYGADLITSEVGSGFPRKIDFLVGPNQKGKQHYANHPWNLNNMPVLNESVLSHWGSGISGMIVPWVYVGMCFSSFCWHTEDHWSYSINYMHWGEPKIWYGIAGADGEKFDDIVRELVPDLFAKQPDLLHHMTTQLNPSYVMRKGVPVYTVHQSPGEFVITFPRAYHAGYNEGFNFAEAVNFAPPDWLRMGRLCLQNYASVRRNCVFAHDELVLKVAKSPEKLSICMCVSIVEELYNIQSHEEAGRTMMKERGVVNSERVTFEEILDDLRTCIYCRSTIYMSGLKCAHPGRIVCLEHVEFLCEHCKPEECTIQYRHTMEELRTFINRLEKRTAGFDAWILQVRQFINVDNKDVPKMKLEEARSLVDRGVTSKYPLTNEVAELKDLIKACEKPLHDANSILTRKIRLRNSTRCQKADERKDSHDLQEVVQSLQAAPFAVSQNLMDALEELLKHVNAWTEKAKEAAKVDLFNVTDFDETLKKIKTVHDEGEEYNLKLVDLDKLGHLMSCIEWMQKAADVKEKIEAWEANPDGASMIQRTKTGYVLKLEDETDIDKKLVSDLICLDEIENLCREGASFDFEGPVSENQSYLEAKIKAARRSDKKAEEFFEDEENATLEKAELLWNELKPHMWSDTIAMNTLRAELRMARTIVERLESIQRGNVFSEKSLSVLVNGCDNSQLVDKGCQKEKIEAFFKEMDDYLVSVKEAFQNNPSYHTLYEILVGKEDIAGLVEGQITPLTLFSWDDPLRNLESLEQFETIEQLKYHLDNVQLQEQALLPRLRSSNQTKSVEETCVCLQTRTKSTGTISCYVCAASFHYECITWNPFFDMLPPGVYLCPRCLRGKRPSTDSIAELKTEFVLRSMEHYFVEHLQKRATRAAEFLESSVATGNKEKIHHDILSMLSLEAVHYPTLGKLKSGELFMINEQDRDLMISLKAVEGKVLPRTIFATKSPKKNSRKRSSTSSLRRRNSKAKKSTLDHDEEQRRIQNQENNVCEAPLCIKPCSQEVNWIQCQSGCERWFHYVCIGLTIPQVSETAFWGCSQCPDHH